MHTLEYVYNTSIMHTVFVLHHYLINIYLLAFKK